MFRLSLVFARCPEHFFFFLAVLQFSFLQIFLDHSEVDVLHATVDEMKLHAEFPAAYVAAKAQRIQAKTIVEKSRVRSALVVHAGAKLV